ncbi:MAG: hypothetical protein PVG66_13570 [Chromatiales bacterium]|jgi:hypothetical protein
MNKLFSVSALALLSMTTGCASIVNGQNQSLSIETRDDASQVSGADCKLSNNKGTWYVVSPGSTVVHRSYEDLSVVCEKEGLDPGMASVKSSTKPMAFGNIIFGGVIGAGIDMANGSAYDYPSLVTVKMGESTVVEPPKQEEEAAQAQPELSQVSDADSSEVN